MTKKEKIANEILECEVDLEVHDFMVKEVRKQPEVEWTNLQKQTIAYAQEEVPLLKARLEALRALQLSETD